MDLDFLIAPWAMAWWFREEGELGMGIGFILVVVVVVVVLECCVSFAKISHYTNNTR